MLGRGIYFFFLPFPPLPFLSDLAVLGLSSFLPCGLFFFDQACRGVEQESSLVLVAECKAAMSLSG